MAFSCCMYDGGEEEKRDMDAARERGWKGKFTKPGRVIRPGAIRINGKCPLTPLEVIYCHFHIFSRDLDLMEHVIFQISCMTVLSWLDQSILILRETSFLKNKFCSESIWSRIKHMV